MSKTLYLIFNHTLTHIQEDDGKKSLGISSIVNLPQHLKDLWKDIPPDIKEINDFLNPLKIWLKENAKLNDYILIQGDFGACYHMVNFAFKNKFIPVYSTTKRIAKESISSDGSVVLKHQFKHCIFRKYGE